MPSRQYYSSMQWITEEFRHQRIAQPQFRGEHVPTPPLPSDAIAMHRQILVSNLFAQMKYIQNINNGYALRFHRSESLEDLIGSIAAYIVFESLHSPQLTFEIVQEPHGTTFSLQVQGLKSDDHDVTSLSLPSDSPAASLV